MKKIFPQNQIKMKHLSKIAFAIILSLIFCACNDNEYSIAPDLVDNSENIGKLISSFDSTFKEYISNPSLSNDELGNLFIDNARKRGLTIIEFNSGMYSKSDDEDLTLSSEYLNFSNEIRIASNSSTNEGFKSNLDGLKINVLNSVISTDEKQILVDNIKFMIAFVDWMDTIEALNSNKSSLLSKSDCDGWWSCWGQCVAGIIGEAISGGVAGCGVGAGVGAAVGTIVPGAGTASGAVGGCVAGGVVGAIGGGLSGAADHCN